jgi:hypothetical protein
MARAKRVSKQYGTKTPAKPTRNLPSKGKRTTSQRIKAATAPDRTVRVLTSENAKFVGRPGASKSKWGNIPGVVDGKQSVRRVMQRDPRRGTSLPQADKITSAGIDLIGKQSVKVLKQPLPNTQGNRYDNARKSIPAPRKSKPVYSNKPGRVRRSPGS